MHVVLLILKIIGAILGSILGLLLLLVILLLFVPVRYRLHLVSHGGVNVKARVSWLFYIVHLSILYEQKKYKYCLRIFGIPIKQNRDEKKETATKRRKNEKGPEAKQVKTEKSDTIEDKLQTTEKIEDVFDKPKKKRTFHPFQVLKKMWQSVRMKLINIPKLWKNFFSKLKKLADKKNKLFALLKDEGTKSSLRKIKKTLFGLIRYISPRTLKGYIRFGTDDPCQTGQILGGISILQAYLNLKVRFYPDFEKKVFEADLKAHGRMRVIRFLFDGGKLYFDKEIKKFIADVKQLKEDLNG